MVSVMLYPCMFCVALSMDLFVLCVACLTLFVNYYKVECAFISPVRTECGMFVMCCMSVSAVL